jgi:hypothetical protein
MAMRQENASSSVYVPAGKQVTDSVGQRGFPAHGHSSQIKELDVTVVVACSDTALLPKRIA